MKVCRLDAILPLSNVEVLHPPMEFQIKSTSPDTEYIPGQVTLGP